MLLDIEDLIVEFHTYRGTVHALNGVTFSIDKGEVLGLAGETGSGKSVTAFSIQRLLPSNASIVSGKIIFDGVNLLDLSEEEMQKVRGRKMATIFQDPHTYLNPVFKIETQFLDVLKKQDPEVLDAKDNREKERIAREKAINMLRRVKMPAPERVMKMFPHELSGGMKQRVLLAMAYSMGPELIIADEATTALDVTIQAQVLEIMKELQREKDLSVLLITHDLGIIAENCQKVAIMYAGRVVEFGPVGKVLLGPKHPYTKGLIKALPRTDKEVVPEGIPGTVPDLVNPPTGCPFNLRCPYAMAACKTKLPPYYTEDEVSTACNLYIR